jgi:hypothetical protein
MPPPSSALRIQTPAAQRCHTGTKIALAQNFVDCRLQMHKAASDRNFGACVATFFAEDSAYCDHSGAPKVLERLLKS